MKARKRIIAAIMATVFTVLQVAELAPVSQVEAASTVNAGSVNLLEHSDFEETDVALVPHDNVAGSKLNNWSNYPNDNVTKKVQHDAHTGEWAVELNAADGALEQDTDELTVGADYVATVWAKVTDPSASVYFGVKNYGGQEIKQKITSDEYTQYSIPFTYTGSPSGQYTRVYVWVESMSSGAVYVDDFTLMSDSDLEQVSIENGKITVDYKADHTGTPSKDDFSVVYTSSLDQSDKKELVITGENVNGSQLELLFDEIAQQPMEQLITADVTYIPKNQTFTLDYTVESNGEALVDAKAESFEVSNGTATVVLDQDPTVAPVKDDFKLEKSVNGGAYSEVAVKSFTYNKESKTVTLQFTAINLQPEEQEVVMKLTYHGEEKTASFHLEAGTGTVYYVDATEGNDNNNGTSPETAWQSIEKVNSVEFQPGDQILFQCGEVWTGALKPQGSGEEGSPIIIASYGEGEKPVLKPGANWTIPYFQPGAPGANGVKYNPTVNNGISFYNQEYWEVRDLELYDPTYSDTTNPTVYRRGINITAEDVGDLYHFTFDNLTIHGFRGPTDNAGKSSGGIIMTVISDPYNSANRVPTAVHDITVTNCEMYDLGRSGFNFVSPWTNRTGSEWGAFGYNGYGDWKPYENITIANNTIYNIDGDGILIDGCKNVLVEHNVVYRTVLNCWYGVGMFNWNSDDTVFQFNEVYETFPADSLLGAGDGQGVEIDALNRDTLVQYNYIHDNTGGCIMWCSTDNLRTIRGTYRYNIFQNDLTKHGVIDWRTNHKESMAYNNTFYFGELPEGSVERKFMNNGYMNGKSEAQFYNNIFYNMDEMNLNTFNEQEIDWESNIFYGFDSVPSNDSTVITEDPMFVNPGSGTYGLDSVTGYKLQAGSPAINAGLNIEDNGGRDYFGIPLTDGKTDIGAAEYLDGDSPDVPEPDVKTVTAISLAKEPTKVKYVEGETFDPSGLSLNVAYDDGTTSVVRYKRHNASDFGFEPAGELTLKDTTITITYQGQTTELEITVVESSEGPSNASRDVEVERYTMTAGSTQPGNSVNSATDGDTDTFWEVEWDIGNTYPEKLWFQIELDEAEELDALRYYPRYGTSNGSTNGFITGYRVDVSMDGENWSTASEGTWEMEDGWKLAEFTEPVTAKYIRLVATETYADVGNNSNMSIAEIRVRKASTDPSDSRRDIAMEYLTAISGSEYLPAIENEGPDEFVLDGLGETHWHTDWSTSEGKDVANRWVGISLSEMAEVDGLRYLPRQGSSHNGDITEYKIQYRTTDDGEWLDIEGATGEWDKDDDNWKIVRFDAVTAKQVRLVGVHTYASGGNDAHMSVAELRLTGKIVGGTVNPPETVDKEYLAYLIEFAESLNATDYVDFTELEAALAAAKAVYENENATAKDVDEAGDRLMTAIENLEQYSAVPEAKAELTTVIEYAESLNADDYVDFTAVEKAIAAAKAVCADANATLTDVLDAYDALVDAVEALEEKAETPVEEDEVVRLSGSDRYATGIAAADELKAVLGVEKFDTVVIATGKGYADALSGSYLAAVKNAPILLTSGKAANIAELHAYIKANVKAGATIYVLGGEAAVSKEAATIEGYDVTRLAGGNRYETNLAILAEAGYEGQEDLLVATGKSFADSLSASAAARPILLVKPNATLTDEQKAVAANFANIYVIGGEGAVSAATAKELSAYGTVTRLAGASRYETSVAVAEAFFTNPETVVLAYGKNFPDGLCGGALAAALNAPLILAKEGNEDAAAAYVAANGIASGYVLGGDGVLPDDTIVTVFGLESASEIIGR